MRWGPSYLTYKKAKPKPKMKVGVGTTSKPPKPKSNVPSLKKPPKPKPSQPAPAPPATSPVPSIQGPAPPSLQGEDQRITGVEDYGNRMNSVNYQLMQAAMRYGGAPSVQQFGYTPGGGDTSTLVPLGSNPGDNSALSTIARNSALQATNIDQTQNAQNTYFSGNRLTALQRNEDDSARQRLTALQEYEAAVADLVNQLMSARSGRDSAVRQASIADIEAANAVEPPAAVSEEESPPETSKPSTPKKKKKKPSLKKPKSKNTRGTNRGKK